MASNGVQKIGVISSKITVTYFYGVNCDIHHQRLYDKVDDAEFCQQFLMYVSIVSVSTTSCKFYIPMFYHYFYLSRQTFMDVHCILKVQFLNDHVDGSNYR